MTRKHPLTRRLRLLPAALAAVASLGTAPLAGATPRGDHARVSAAGYTLKRATIDGVSFSYAEGPDNGPPLVLLHAQFLDWFSYYRVLPALAKSYHVFDIDYPGHGATRTAPDYPMNANRIGKDLGLFIQRKIGKPVYISGNSSGGLLAVWLAANRPGLIRAALLEDPPLFASEYPAIKKTVAYRAFRTSATALKDHPKDFLRYWIHRNAPFFRNNIGPGTPFLLSKAVGIYQSRHPGQPVELGLLPNPTVRMLVRGLSEYDPRFGAAFYDGTWNKGFDQAAALARIRCPVLLMQADVKYLKDGTLDAAMSTVQAKRAMSLLRHGTYLKVNATHVVNLDKPGVFLSAVNTAFGAK
ncbi:alpha/beta fold hydrolase [Acidimangrovimonas sediminis]|uniref:alpha/beta fold hydrolase n=1 Tax=Acidimangrovimonas sediminis TaxID=2056283 RepID=UPI000C7F7EDB|nr:alpha/beta hydrolase [Acidimangrovimonas sediminis]